MKIQVIFFEDWDVWKYDVSSSLYACVNDLNEARARNQALSCSIVFNYSYFFGVVLASVISTIPDNACIIIRGQHSLRIKQWNHLVLGSVTGSDTLCQQTYWLRGNTDWKVQIECESLTDGSSSHCFLNSSLVGRDIFRRHFRAIAVKEGLSVVSCLPGDYSNRKGEDFE